MQRTIYSVGGAPTEGEGANVRARWVPAVAGKCTVGIHEYTHTLPFGILDLDGDRIVQLREKPGTAYRPGAGGIADLRQVALLHFKIAVHPVFGKNLVLGVMQHAFSSQVVSVKDASFDNKPKAVSLEINEAKEGSSFVINNLYYNTNSADIKKESFVVLDAFLEYLKENSTTTIEVQGYTDNVGQASANEA